MPFADARDGSSLHVGYTGSALPIVPARVWQLARHPLSFIAL